MHTHTHCAQIDRHTHTHTHTHVRMCVLPAKRPREIKGFSQGGGGRRRRKKVERASLRRFMFGGGLFCDEQSSSITKEEEKTEEDLLTINMDSGRGMRRADLCTSIGRGARHHTKSNHFALFCLTPTRRPLDESVVYWFCFSNHYTEPAFTRLPPRVKNQLRAYAPTFLDPCRISFSWPWPTM